MILTIYHTVEHVRHAIQAGASGFVLKDTAGQELVSAVRVLYEGGNYYSAKIDRIAEEVRKQMGKNI